MKLFASVKALAEALLTYIDSGEVPNLLSGYSNSPYLRPAIALCYIQRVRFVSARCSPAVAGVCYRMP